MTQVAGETRQFSVYARHVDSHHARVLEEASFEAAALSYVEDFHPPTTEDHEISVIVREVGTGHEHGTASGSAWSPAKPRPAAKASERPGSLTWLKRAHGPEYGLPIDLART